MSVFLTTVYLILGVLPTFLTRPDWLIRLSGLALLLCTGFLSYRLVRFMLHHKGRNTK